MKRLVWVLMIVLSPALAAQTPPDSGGSPPDEAQAQQLREEIRQRWKDHVRSTLGLSDDQTTKLQATEQRFEEQRQPLRARQREINQALNGELASGAPNQDRVTQFMNERQENQLKLQEVNRGEDREMQGYLTPVQRARYQEERRKFQERVAELVRHRREQQRHPMIRPRGGARKRPRP